MAIDTRAKRVSMINFGEGDQILFDPDNVVGAGDRAHMLGLYSGISLDLPSEAGGDGYMAMSYFGLVRPPSGW